jgi:hypothetical protein
MTYNTIAMRARVLQKVLRPAALTTMHFLHKEFLALIVYCMPFRVDALINKTCPKL